MTDFRQDVLIGTQAAAKLHRIADVENRFVRRSCGIDVYGIAGELDVPVVFKPLTGLLGAYMRHPSPGILVTTERPPGVQRFTASHEIGHFFLEHEKSFDAEDDIGTLLKGKPSIEIQANAFAAEFLMPRWLISSVAKILLKAGLRIPDPVAVYQLSLRLGTSYEATVRTLTSHNLIRPEHEADLAIPVKSIKQKILGDVALDKWHPNVWLLTKDDDKDLIEATEKDVVVLTVKEASTTGIVSRYRQQGHLDARVLAEKISLPSSSDGKPLLVGGVSTYSAVVQTNSSGYASMAIEQGQPWEDNFASALDINVEVNAPENGRSKKQRQLMMQELAAP